MTPHDVLIELLARVGACDGAAVLVSEHELSQWPGAAVSTMKAQRLLTKARSASSAVCPGCEEECVMPVHVLPSKTDAPSAFIICDKRSDTDRVAVSVDRLQQWQCSADAVCGFVAASLGLRRSDKRRPANADLLEIGIVTGDKRSQMLALRLQHELALTAGNSTIPLADLVNFEDDSFAVDAVMVRQMVDTAPPADPRHTPTTAKREVRKSDTQAMYVGWQKAYRKLLKTNPGKSDVWYAKQIEKTPAAQSRNYSTIKKHMHS